MVKDDEEGNNVDEKLSLKPSPGLKGKAEFPEALSSKEAAKGGNNGPAVTGVVRECEPSYRRLGKYKCKTYIKSPYLCSYLTPLPLSSQSFFPLFLCRCR